MSITEFVNRFWAEAGVAFMAIGPDGRHWQCKAYANDSQRLWMSLEGVGIGGRVSGTFRHSTPHELDREGWEVILPYEA